MGDNDKTITFNTVGLSDIRKDVDLTGKALQRLEKLYEQVAKKEGAAAENARNILNQQKIQIKEKGVDLAGLRDRYAGLPTGPERMRLEREQQKKQLGIERLVAKGQTVVSQALLPPKEDKPPKKPPSAFQTFLGASGAPGGKAFRALKAGGPLIAGAAIAGTALKKLAVTVKKASDSFVAFSIEKVDLARSATGSPLIVKEFMKNFNKEISYSMRQAGFSSAESLGFAGGIMRQGGMRGEGHVERMSNLQEDVLGSARLTRFFGMQQGQGADLVGRARAAGLGGENVAGFLGGAGERARLGAPALRGRVAEFLGQAVDYLKNISTTLDKSEKRDAVNFFTRVMGGLAKKGAEFTGSGMKQMMTSVDQVLQSGQGIIGGTFGRFLTQRVMQEPGASQIDVLKKLDQGIMADGGKVFQEMLREMKSSTGSLDNVAVILAGETKRKFTETKAFLEIVEGLDLTTKGGLSEFQRRVDEFRPTGEADQIRAARAATTDAMLKLGEAIPIFRKVAILVGEVAESFLPEKMSTGKKMPTKEELAAIQVIDADKELREARAVGGDPFGADVKKTIIQIFDKDGIFFNEVEATIDRKD